jgi:hypothetical protein
MFVEFLFYFGKAGPFLHRLTLTTQPDHPVSHQHSRKTFFAKLLGLFAVAGVAPKLLARPSASPADAPVSKAAPFKVSQDSRTVARSADTV